MFAAFAVLSALYLDQLTLIGLVFIITPFLILRNKKRLESLFPTIYIDVFFGLYFVAMLLKLLPGFPDTVVLNQRIIGHAQAPFGITLNFSLPFAGLFLLAFYTKNITSINDLRKTFFSKTGVMLWLGLPIVFFIPGILLGVKPEVKLLAITPFVLACNLFLIAIPEEAFFRGFLQKRLQMVVGRFTLFLTPLLFTLYHLPSNYGVSISYFIIVFIAGSLFSFVFYKSDRVESAIAAHFMINAIHFVFLTYPY